MPQTRRPAPATGWPSASVAAAVSVATVITRVVARRDLLARLQRVEVVREPVEIAPPWHLGSDDAPGPAAMHRREIAGGQPGVEGVDPDEDRLAAPVRRRRASRG